MPSTKQKFSSKKVSKSKLVSEAYAHADTTNGTGFPAFTKPWQEELIQMLTTNILQDTFYVGAEELSKQALAIHRYALKTDPIFYAKALIYARTKGHMKLQPILGAVFLTTLPTKNIHFGVAKTFMRIILTPKDTDNFIIIARNKELGIRQGLGSHPKTLLRKFLAHRVDEHWAVKYPTELRKIITLTKPRSKDWLYAEDKQIAKAGAIVEYLRMTISDSFRPDPEILPQLAYYYDFIHGSIPHAQAIREGKLDIEIESLGFKINDNVWKEIFLQMPIFAFLKNLRNIVQRGLIDDREIMDKIDHTIGNPEIIKKSKILPFNFYQAYQVLQQDHEHTIPPQLYTALESALESSLINLPRITKKVLIGIDVSGSMDNVVSSNHMTLAHRKKNIAEVTVRFVDIAALFGAILSKAYPLNTVTVGFDTNEVRNMFNPTDSILTNMEKIIDHARGGGTNMDIPLAEALRRHEHYDYFVGITDTMEWAGSGFMTTLHAYKNLNPSIECVLIRIDAYITNPTSFDEKNVHMVYGWSDTVITYVLDVLSGQTKTQLDEVNKIEL